MSPTPNPIVYAIPAFLILIAVELATWRREVREGRDDTRGYVAKDSAANLTMGLGNLAVSLSLKGATFGLSMWLYQHRMFDLPGAAWVWLLLIPAEDLCYYWFHRSSHQVRILWAAHINHHSSTTYNLTTALRQSWLTPITGPLFWAPLPLLGFDPVMVVTAQAISLMYQFWIHTEQIDKLGPLEWVLNTPSHHRVHHGRNVRYLDKNHGGILIVWDRLFGTFEAETEKADFGLTTNIDTYNPVRIAFHEVASIAADVKAAPTWRAKLGYVFMPPGWRHDGPGTMSRDLQAALAAEEGNAEAVAEAPLPAPSLS